MNNNDVMVMLGFFTVIVLLAWHWMDLTLGAGNSDDDEEDTT